MSAAYRELLQRARDGQALVRRLQAIEQDTEKLDVLAEAWLGFHQAENAAKWLAGEELTYGAESFR